MNVSERHCPARPTTSGAPEAGRGRPSAGFLLVVLLAATAASAPAQEVAQACRWLQTPTVGGWARYRLTAGIPADTPTVRIAIVGRARLDGVQHFWQETVLQSGSSRTVIQTLVPASPYDPTTIRRAIIQAPGQRAVEVPPEALATLPSGARGSAGADACQRGQPVGWETIAVPAGTFRALHVRYERAGRHADSWLVPSIPFALARSIVSAPGDSTRPVELVLLERGFDAGPTLPLPSTEQR
jgi:hypothetical protein